MKALIVIVIMNGFYRIRKIRKIKKKVIIVILNTIMSLTTNQVIKYYQTVSRTFDNIAKEDGYTNCPDELLSLIFDYTGKIQTKPSCFYQVKVEFEYRSRYNQKRLDVEIKDMIDNLYPKAMIDKKRLNPYSNWRKTYRWLKYCACCDRFYKSIDSHIIREIHHRNYHTKGDLLKEPDFRKGILRDFDNGWRDYEIRNIEKIEYSEYFTYREIPKPQDKKNEKINKKLK